MLEHGSSLNPPLVILGAGGHARVLIELIQLSGGHSIVGLLDPRPELHGARVLGVMVLGGDEQLPALRAAGVGQVVVGMGSIGDARPRRRAYEHALALGFAAVVLAHPHACLSAYASLGPGTMVLAAAVVGVGATIGANVIINTAAVVEHDCVVGDHAHIATRACLAGGVRIGASAHIGANAVVRQGLTIGEGAIVGAGAAVVRDVPPWTTVVGVPARPSTSTTYGARGATYD